MYTHSASFFLTSSTKILWKWKPFCQQHAFVHAAQCAASVSVCTHSSRVVLRGDISGLKALLLLQNNQKKPWLKRCFLYLLWRIMMPLLVFSCSLTIYLHLHCAQHLTWLYILENHIMLTMMICTIMAKRSQRNTATFWIVVKTLMRPQWVYSCSAKC